MKFLEAKSIVEFPKACCLHTIKAFNNFSIICFGLHSRIQTLTYRNKCSRGHQEGLGLDNMIYKEITQGLCLFSLEKAVVGCSYYYEQYQMGRCRERGVRYFLKVHCYSTRGNKRELEQRKIWIAIQKEFFIMRVVIRWNKLSQGAMESPFLEISESELRVANLDSALSRWVGQDTSRGVFWSALVSSLVSKDVHTTVTTCYRNSLLLSGTSAAKEETAHDTGTVYLLGAVKPISALCMQWDNSYQCTFVKCLLFFHVLGKWFFKLYFWMSSVNSFASLTAQKQYELSH